MRKADIYIPENASEESYMLMGRINAFAAYVREEKYAINRGMCAAILGFDLEEPREENGDV